MLSSVVSVIIDTYPNLIQCDKDVQFREGKMSMSLSQCINKSVFRMIRLTCGFQMLFLCSYLDLLHIQVLLL